MKSLILIISTALIMTACQTGTYKDNKRTVASGQAFAKFLMHMAAETSTDAVKIEKSIISYIQRHDESAGTQGYELLGITREEANRIKSLSDDLPYMGRVQRLVMKNMTKIDPNLNSSIASRVYAKISDGPNPYSVKAVTTGSVRRAKRKPSLPKGYDAVKKEHLKILSSHKSIAEEHVRILSSIEALNVDSKLKKVFQENYMEYMRRGVDEPALMVNAQDMMNSAIRITEKTGVSSIGDGCVSFTSTASIETLSVKANIDARTLERLENINLVGRSPAEMVEEVSKARSRSFSDTLGYTDDEAISAVKRLKGTPCKVY
jgi:hypothetical protein